MNQPTHAWLAVEAYRKVEKLSKTPEGKELDGLSRLLGANLGDVVVAAWLPDSLIKDMAYGHVFKNSLYKGDQTPRFKLSRNDLKDRLCSTALIPKEAFHLVPDSWWERPYRVKENGGHLPARVNALCQTARDMLKMGDNDVIELTGVGSSKGGRAEIAQNLLYSPRNISMTLWMASHYIADAHMPFHSDNRSLASTNKQNTHGDTEKLWGEQVSELFHSKKILRRPAKDILGEGMPEGSRLAGIDFGGKVMGLKNNGDPWKEAVYICRAGFASSFALVPPDISDVDAGTSVSLKDILKKGFCGEERFWDISRAVMRDAANSIAMFWQDVWLDFVKDKK